MAMQCSRNNKTDLEFHVKFQTYLPDFYQIWIFSTDFHESPQHLISRKPLQWELR